MVTITAIWGDRINIPKNIVESTEYAVDYLGLLDTVDREKIGIVGICGFGGMSLNAAAIDKRIKAVVTTSMYDMTRVMAKGYFDSMTKEERTKLLEQLGQERWKDAEAGKFRLSGQGLPEKLTGEEAHSKYFSEDIYREAAEPKELVILPKKYHTDLYDRTDVIPFEKITNFFKKNLK